MLNFISTFPFFYLLVTFLDNLKNWFRTNCYCNVDLTCGYSHYFIYNYVKFCNSLFTMVDWQQNGLYLPFLLGVGWIITPRYLCWYNELQPLNNLGIQLFKHTQPYLDQLIDALVDKSNYLSTWAKIVSFSCFFHYHWIIKFIHTTHSSHLSK